MGNADRIKEYARQVSSAKKQISELERKMNRQKESTKEWWDSSTGEGFRSAYVKRVKKLEPLESYIVQLQRHLRDLAVDVQRAEDERKKEQEARRKQR